MTLPSVLGISLVLGALLPGATRPLLLRLGLVDTPNHRSSHDAPTLRGGGLSLIIVVSISWLLMLAGSTVLTSTAYWIVAAIVLLGVLGFVEDVRGLSVEARIVAQFVISVVLSVGLSFSLDFSAWWVLALPPMAVFTVNAANFMDGVNAISSIHGITLGGTAIIVALETGVNSMGLIGAVVLGAFVGFLPWNAPKAYMFLGDVGSYSLGAAQWSLGVWMWDVTGSILIAVAPAIIYASDVLGTLTHRAIQLVPLTESHRDHIYQGLQSVTGSHLLSAGTVGAFTILACSFSVWVWTADIPTIVGWLGLGLLCGGYLSITIGLCRAKEFQS